MHIFEEADEIDKYNEFVEVLYGLLQPKAYQKWKKGKDLQKAEEGVDKVIYKGEDDWQEIMKEFAAFGLTNIDPFGEGLKKK
jgi:hypothetical protein